MKKIALVLLTGIFFGCASNSDDFPSTPGVKFRVMNVSPYDFTKVSVNDRDMVIEDLDRGEASSYRYAQYAYGYTFIEVNIDNQTYTLQPTDFVGETPLQDGYYTYFVNANGSQSQYDKLSISVIKDR
jgi:hypothetical protein